MRIENSASSNMPDVLMTYAGKTILVELKAKRKISSGQIDWARQWAKVGGTSWFLIKDGSFLYLVPGSTFLYNNNKWEWKLEKKWLVKNCREAIKRIFQ